MNPEQIYHQVTTRYTASARTPPNPHTQTVAHAFGYTTNDLHSIPTSSNLGLSCGNPVALASLAPGERVIDLGCGAGIDVLLASKRVGGLGGVVGVDMNEEMLKKARSNARKTNSTNVTFINSRITAVDLPDSCADVILSNCVVNLVPGSEKPLVFREMHRLLKPGGRVAVSDILTKRTLTEEMQKNVALYVGCVAGASRKEEYEGWLKDAGFVDVVVVDAGADLNVYTQGGETGASCCAPAESDGKNGEEEGSCCGTKGGEGDGGVAADMQNELRDIDLNEWAGK
ncbi:methyltransferase, UbiE/COQ5 family protein [Decorospora gaudefroyi]|uniref:Arsenite methyltransferase n=1 Tax=Decorospora gaudefroyi TaxID=184978 RepID=A0A6A5K9B5_9PLEO|nr:methyltransferase, UbiE/COQ5 family protein [Decorospora gaudefroyi]